MKSLHKIVKEITQRETLIENRSDAEFWMKVGDEYKLVKWPNVSGWEQVGWEGGSRFGDFTIVEYQNFLSSEIVKFDCSDLTEAKGRGLWECGGMGSTVKGKFKSFYDVEKTLSDGTLKKVIDRKWKKAKAMLPKVKGWVIDILDYESEATYRKPELDDHIKGVVFDDFYDGEGYYSIQRGRNGFSEFSYKTKDIPKVLKTIEDDVANGKFN